MTTITVIENAMIDAISALGLFAIVQSAGRKQVPESYSYPACFVYFDGDSDTGNVSRPVDQVDMKVVIQTQNLASEHLAADAAYQVNDQVRDLFRFKTLGLDAIEPFSCVSRSCSDYDDSVGMIEYTHLYRTRLYNPVPVP